MKRTPLQRKTPMRRRRTRIRPVGKTKYRRRDRDFDFMAFVLEQPCLLRGALGAGACLGRVQADHAGARGLGVKAPDDTCIPLCLKHHGNRTDYTGWFKGWDGTRMREFCNLQIYLTQSLYARLCELGQTGWRRRLA